MVQPDLSRPTWLGYIPRWYTRPKTVTHPSTNRDQCTVTSFMRQTTLLPPTVCVSVIALQNGFSYQHQRYSPQQLEVIDNTFHLDYSFNQTKGHCRTQIGSCSFYSNAMMCRLLWWPEMPKIYLLTYSDRLTTKFGATVSVTDLRLSVSCRPCSTSSDCWWYETSASTNAANWVNCSTYTTAANVLNLIRLVWSIN